MRSNGFCKQCGMPVRTCVSRNGGLLDVEPTASQARGYITVEFGADGLAYATIHGSPAEVPSSEPMRYVVHKCR